MKELQERELRKLRELSNKCSANKKTQEYVHEVCLRIKELLIHYARDTKQDTRKVLEKYLGHTAAPANFSTGQIPAKYIAKAIEAGNIRERITLIMNFCMSGCAVILWALEKNKYFTQASIDVLHKRLYNLTGIHDIAKINKYMKRCERKGCILPCKFISLASDGAVSASRMSAYPLNNALREPRVKKIDRYYVKVKDVYPKLSKYELEYIKVNCKYEIKNNNNKLQWISGLQYWEVNENNFYIKLMRQYKQMVVCGPSGNTDLNLSIFRLFDNFDINLAIFACISQMCNTPDHSPCEILLAALPYGLDELDDWTIDQDSFKYIYKKLKMYSSK
jgi:hypothetical protein